MNDVLAKYVEFSEDSEGNVTIKFNRKDLPLIIPALLREIGGLNSMLNLLGGKDDGKAQKGM